MPRYTFKAGETVSWVMFDGSVMAGTVLGAPLYDTMLVKRVDGSIVAPRIEDCRIATPDDVLEACAFYSRP